jgi:hypothetical protein
MTKKKSVIRADFYPLEKITDEDIKVMHSVFVKYYYNADYKTFVKDLKKKTGAILLKKIDDGTIVGFSTIGLIEKTIDRKRCLGIFSGDTVIEKEYWGLSNLQTAFLRFLVMTRIKNPLTKLYWFLITKGFKTYLLMANNWLHYYPRYDKMEDEKRKSIVKTFSNHLFEGVYDEKTGLLKFGDDYQRLKEGVADITDEMKRKYPKIAFFEQVNPTWREGTELPCIGDIDWFTIIWRPVPFAFRKIRNTIFGCASREQAKKIKRDTENELSKIHNVSNPHVNTMIRKTEQEI